MINTRQRHNRGGNELHTVFRKTVVKCIECCIAISQKACIDFPRISLHFASTVHPIYGWVEEGGGGGDMCEYLFCRQFFWLAGPPVCGGYISHDSGPSPDAVLQRLPIPSISRYTAVNRIEQAIGVKFVKFFPKN